MEGLQSRTDGSDSAETQADHDHIAIAAEHAIDNFARYRGDLGGAWVAGMYDPGFYWGQLRFANGSSSRPTSARTISCTASSIETVPGPTT